MISKLASFAAVQSRVRVDAATPASSNPDASSHKERRRSFRFRIFGRIARLDALGDRGLTRVQDLSDGGAKIETAIELRSGDPVRLSLDCAHELQARVVWANGSLAGIRFLVPINAAAVIRDIASRAATGVARAPRVSVHARARATFPTRPANISQ